MKVPMNRALLAALAFGLASGPVSAQIDLTKITPDNTTDDVYTYAQDTVDSTSTITGTDDAKTKYYTLTGDDGNSFNFRFDLGVASNANDTALIEVELTDMVFGNDAVLSNGTNGGNTWGRVSGGTAGDTTALFRATGGAGTATDDMTLGVTDTSGSDVMGVTATHKGGIAITVINQNLKQLGLASGEKKYPTKTVVVGAPAIMSKVMGEETTATVTSGFTGFDAEGDDTTAVLGSVHIELASSTPVAADDGVAADRSDVYTAAKLMLKGDLSFVETVSAGTGTDCGTDTIAFTILDGDMSARPTASEGAINGTNFEAAAQDICITAKTDVTIPKASYTIDIDYTTPPNRLSPLADVTGKAFGSILHDGTTINIPYVSTHEKYNQRFMIVNNGTATKYEFTFTPESGITATGGLMASGDLPMGTTHLKAGDIVTLSGGNRTAATFTAVAEKANIEMSSVLVTRSTGATDLTVLMAEE